MSFGHFRVTIKNSMV